MVTNTNKKKQTKAQSKNFKTAEYQQVFPQSQANLLRLET